MVIQVSRITMAMRQSTSRSVGTLPEPQFGITPTNNITTSNCNTSSSEEQDMATLHDDQANAYQDDLIAKMSEIGVDPDTPSNASIDHNIEQADLLPTFDALPPDEDLVPSTSNAFQSRGRGTAALPTSTPYHQRGQRRVADIQARIEKCEEQLLALQDEIEIIRDTRQGVFDFTVDKFKAKFKELERLKEQLNKAVRESSVSDDEDEGEDQDEDESEEDETSRSRAPSPEERPQPPYRREHQNYDGEDSDEDMPAPSSTSAEPSILSEVFSAPSSSQRLSTPASKDDASSLSPRRLTRCLPPKRPSPIEEDLAWDPRRIGLEAETPLSIILPLPGPTLLSVSQSAATVTPAASSSPSPLVDLHPNTITPISTPQGQQGQVHDEGSSSLPVGTDADAGLPQTPQNSQPFYNSSHRSMFASQIPSSSLLGSAIDAGSELLSSPSPFVSDTPAQIPSLTWTHRPQSQPQSNNMQEQTQIMQLEVQQSAPELVHVDSSRSSFGPASSGSSNGFGLGSGFGIASTSAASTSQAEPQQSLINYTPLLNPFLGNFGRDDDDNDDEQSYSGNRGASGVGQGHGQGLSQNMDANAGSGAGVIVGAGPCVGGSTINGSYHNVGISAPRVLEQDVSIDPESSTPGANVQVENGSQINNIDGSRSWSSNVFGVQSPVQIQVQPQEYIQVYNQVHVPQVQQTQATVTLHPSVLWAAQILSQVPLDQLYPLLLCLPQYRRRFGLVPQPEYQPPPSQYQAQQPLTMAYVTSPFPSPIFEEQTQPEPFIVTPVSACDAYWADGSDNESVYSLLSSSSSDDFDFEEFCPEFEVDVNFGSRRRGYVPGGLALSPDLSKSISLPLANDSSRFVGGSQRGHGRRHHRFSTSSELDWDRSRCQPGSVYRSPKTRRYNPYSSDSTLTGSPRRTYLDASLTEPDAWQLYGGRSLAESPWQSLEGRKRRCASV
ncbi:hypothetical protein D9758_003017 [Tetrapyrgos nigripes]|uniref:Uncharacterized protein n=1 Tax=Tetrapyrgos nigripes TaxID=182062 RepID=A0A8H5GPQ3_9AGAR|nr:hypothetical protein D9758_003017 [Tetrapyrgos nigripes]